MANQYQAQYASAYQPAAYQQAYQQAYQAQAQPALHQAQQQPVQDQVPRTSDHASMPLRNAPLPQQYMHTQPSMNAYQQQQTYQNYASSSNVQDYPIGLLKDFYALQTECRNQLTILSDFKTLIKRSRASDPFPEDSILPMARRACVIANESVGPQGSALPSPETTQLAMYPELVSAEEKRREKYIRMQQQMIKAETSAYGVTEKVFEKLTRELDEKCEEMEREMHPRQDEEQEESASSAPNHSPPPSAAPQPIQHTIMERLATFPAPTKGSNRDPLFLAKVDHIRRRNERIAASKEEEERAAKRMKMIDRMMANPTRDEPPAKRIRCKSR